MKRRRIGQVRLIAIDEVSVRKGQRYLPNVVDLKTGKVIYTTEKVTRLKILSFMGLRPRILIR
ncbi:MAG: hypothetical protein JSU72_15495 [Deltaproteobacteria bacterium]|nr:MAG: hypothetical protein JSU72_15495 [Deltaproteobacteria bacterium]